MEIKMSFAVAMILSSVLILCLRLVYSYNEKKKIELKNSQTGFILWAVFTLVIYLLGNILISVENYLLS